MLEPIVGQTLHINKIWRRIMIEIGTSDALLRDTVRDMIKLGLIHEVKENHYKVISNVADI